MPKSVGWGPELDLDEVKRIGRATGTTVNDVLLGAISGTLTRYLREHGDGDLDEVVWMVPVVSAVSTRTWATSSATTSRWSPSACRWVSTTSASAWLRCAGGWTASKASDEPLLSPRRAARHLAGPDAGGHRPDQLLR